MTTEWPLTGRGSVLSELTDLITAGKRSVIVAGQAGVGKTRLVRECHRLVEGSGYAAVWVAATRSSVEIPFGALAPALPTTDIADQGAGAGNQGGLVRRLLDALTEWAGARRLVLFVDDAHLLDEASAMLVHQLAMTRRGATVATIRSGESVPAAVTALWKDDLATRIELPGLPDPAMHDLVCAALGGTVDRAVSGTFALRCRGNALYLREMVAGALTDGTLACDNGLWRLTGPLVPSPRLAELVTVRLAALSEPEYALLELLAYGEPLGPGELSAIDGGLVDTALELERKHLLASEKHGRRLQIRLAHPLYGDVVRSRMSALRARHVAGQLARAVESTGARRADDNLRMMVWQLEAGGAAPDRLAAAAHTARWRYDFDLSHRLAAAAAEAGAGFDADLLLAQLASLRGDAADAERRMSMIEPPDERCRARLAVARLDNMMFCLGDVDRGRQIAIEAEATIRDPRLKEEILARRTGVMALIAQGPAAAAYATVFADQASGQAVVWESLSKSISLCRHGRIDESLEEIERGVRAHGRLDEHMDWYPWFHAVTRHQALTSCGRFAEAHRLAAEQYELGLREHSVERRAFFAWALASSTEACGNADRAVALARESVSLLRDMGRTLFVRAVLPILVTALALHNDTEEAEALLRSPDLAADVPPMWDGAARLMARAWTRAAEGDLSAARQAFISAAEQGESIGDLVGAATALHGLARTGAPELAASPLRRLADAMSSDLVELRADHVEALVSDDHGRLLAVADRFGRIGATLLAAEAAADAAVRLLRRGDHRGGLHAEHLALELATSCGSPRTPALSTIAVRASLTSAERETAALAATGLSSKKIAEHLHLSARTVDNRLQAVYQKLGISSRHDLAQALEGMSK